MPDWLTPALLIALFAWLRHDIGRVEARLTKRLEAAEAGLRRDIADVRADVVDVRDRVSRVEGRIDGWQDQRHPPAPVA